MVVVDERTEGLLFSGPACVQLQLAALRTQGQGARAFRNQERFWKHLSSEVIIEHNRVPPVEVSQLRGKGILGSREPRNTQCYGSGGRGLWRPGARE